MILTYIQTIEDDNKREIVEKIYDAYYPKMLVCAQKILHNEEDALDAVQNAFFNITRTYERFEDTYSNDCAALVYVYTRNSAINIYNKNKKRNNLIFFDPNIDNFPSQDVDFQQEFIQNESIKAVYEAIDSLPFQYRDIIMLKYYYQMNNKDIALIMNITHKTVSNKICQAKRIIQKSIGGNNDD